jgi:hypothetical protein
MGAVHFEQEELRFRPVLKIHPRSLAFATIRSRHQRGSPKKGCRPGYKYHKKHARGADSQATREELRTYQDQFGGACHFPGYGQTLPLRTIEPDAVVKGALELLDGASTLLPNRSHRELVGMILLIFHNPRHNSFYPFSASFLICLYKSMIHHTL